MKLITVISFAVFNVIFFLRSLQKFDGIAEPMVKGLPAEYKFMMKYILFTEVSHTDCCKEQRGGVRNAKP